MSDKCGKSGGASGEWVKTSGFNGVMTIGKEPTFDDVYGSGATPMIVAHDKRVQRLPPVTKIAISSAVFVKSAEKTDAASRPAYDIDGVTNFESLVPVAHKIAIDKGWWKDGIEKRPSGEIVANYHAEVSEAWEEYRAGRMATWYADNTDGPKKPEGFWVEIADLLIRIADAIGAGREPTNSHTRALTGGMNIFARITEPHFVVTLHECISCGEKAVSYCHRFAAINNVDLYAVVREKLRYNATRPYRHGGKLA